MPALTTDRITQKKQPGYKSYPLKAAAKIYAGSLVALDVNGFVVPAADTANLKVVGVAGVTVDNTAGADGAVTVTVEAPILARFAAASITQAMVGRVMYVVDDQTFDDAVGTNAIKAGRLAEFLSTTEGWLEIRPAGAGVVLADADATYGQPEADLINDLKVKVNQLLLG